ncbi:capsule assembly Wzi family protein [Thalassotalea aquiviva]|uniref:capsule assembly Wzi family protein n=1 Tax=Thalassotalea aquiviva TaxID=3242415 RepID=UPI00352AAE68
MMLKTTHLSAGIIGFILATAPVSAFAEPWINPSNVFLRADLQLLADNGHIDIPLTTFPLMWADVGTALRKVDESELDQASKNAYWHVKQKFDFSRRNSQIVELNAANEENRFTSFGDEYRDVAFSQWHFTYMGDSWAVKFAPSVSTDDRRSKNVRVDDSYLAKFWGNWVFAIGLQDRWYGPGWDTNLALTNNARPMPTLSITRKTSHPFKLPYTDLKIPWNLTTTMGQLETDRHIPNALLWTMRFNFKPTQNLELGITRLAQWEGENRPGGLSTFWDVMKGNDNCGTIDSNEDECLAGLEPGNQLAGYDIRYSLNGFNVPLTVHMQMIAEDSDSKGGLSIFGEERYMYGLESRLNMFDTHWLAYVEYADTFADCSDGINVGDGSGVGVGDCYYEHHIYKTGMRYRGRVLGSVYENDTTSLVFGLVSQLNQLESWEIKAKYLDLNHDNSDRHPTDPDKGNTVTKVAEELISLSVKYQFHQGKFKYTLGGSANYSRFESDKNNSFDPTFYFNVQYSL